MHSSFFNVAGRGALWLTMSLLSPSASWPLPVGVPVGVADAKNTAPNASTTPPHGCLATGNGYLRASIRGALKLNVDLHNSELECDGGPRTGGNGVLVSFAGPLRSGGRRLRMVFGVGAAVEGHPGRALPTNLTVIFEGQQRLFATRGDDKCTVDQLTQERLGSSRSYRIVARGFCIAPVSGLRGNERIFISRFDFAGSVTFNP